jgi:uncharacterized protein YegP (UPF0339 family)
MRYEYYQDTRGEWRWTLYAANGEPIAVSSQSYKALGDCLHGIEVNKRASDTIVVDRHVKLNAMAESAQRFLDFASGILTGSAPERQNAMLEIEPRFARAARAFDVDGPPAGNAMAKWRGS